MAISTATELFRMAKDSLLGSFEEAYQQKCLNAAALEQFTLSHPVSEYHYTLYYYDLAGNLVKTISPEGVKPNRDSSWLAQVAQKRQNGEIQVPTHSLATVYRYNTLNQVVTQNSPDGGYSKFWYDRLGRLSVSQNAKQLLETKYSYTKYDVLGRITEVGQKAQSVAMTQVISRNIGQLTDWLNQTYTNTNGDRTMAEQVTATMYDLVDITTTDLPLVIPVNQKSYTLRNRVSYTRTYDYLLALEDNTPRYSLYDFSSTYSYDIHGNVDTLLQQYRTGLLGAHGDNRFKVIAYKYDLVSGKVNQVHYQPGQRDQLYHRYVYDAENRLTDVYVTDSKATINDRDLEEHDAHYEYYKHGPLARTVLGNQQVQGLDYAYTLQGWLKGVNSTGLTTTLDMGNDSKADDRHPLVARDVFGFNLNYFTGDFAAISGKNVFPGHTGIISPSTAYRALYNGNISSMAVNIGKFNQPQLYNYQYDQLNRLVAMDVFRGYVTGSNSWSAITQVNDYKERISYDGNGNILSYLRNGTTLDSGPITMDSMSYKYFTNTDGTYRNNRLRLVRDSVATGNYSVDIDDQLPRVSNAADSNYVYDAIGNLIQDKSENITNIQWSVYGKIQKITKTAVNTGDVSAISYWYDAAGNRVGKKVEALNRKPQYSWYTRDASGNVMGVYQYEGNTLTDDTLRLREHHLYGSSRIGVWNRWINMDLPVSTGTTINLLGKSYDGTFERGNKFFELSNHLGNVLATVSDKKFGHNGGSGVVDYYEADVVTASDYYPFGMLMPGRQFGQGENFPGVLVNGTTTVNGYSLPIDLNLTSRGAGDAAEYVASNSVEFDGEFESSSTDEFSAYIADNTYAGTGNQVSGGGAYGSAGRYRYGFNGKENDNEIKGVGNQQDYGMRIYDPRAGRFLSMDPLYKEYPMFSSYQYAGNRPIVAIDMDGMEPQEHPYLLKPIGKSHIGVTNEGNTYQAYQVNSPTFGKTWVAKISQKVAPISGWEAKPIDHFYYHTSTEGWLFWQKGDEESIRHRMAVKLSNGIGIGLFATIAAGATAPVAAQAGLFSIGNASLGERIISFAADATAQRITNGGWGKVNWMSSASDAIFGSPLTSGVVGSYFNLTYDEGFSTADLSSENNIKGFAWNAGFSALGNFVGGLSGSALGGQIIFGKTTSKLGLGTGEAMGDVFGNVTGNAAQEEVMHEEDLKK